MINGDVNFFSEYKKKIFNDLHVIQLCRVVSVSGNRASVQPLALKQDKSKRAMILGALIPKHCFKCCPDCTHEDIKSGDVVIVGFCDYDIDNYRGNGDFSVSSSRMHSVNDAVVLGVI